MVVCNNLQLVLERKLMVVYNLLPVLERRLMVIMMYNLPVSEIGGVVQHLRQKTHQ